MPLRVKIRGIYTTALTRLLLNEGFMISDPSPKIQERFGLEAGAGPYDIFIRDGEDLQGIEASGRADTICELLAALQENLLDPVMTDFGPADDDDSLDKAQIEFPGRSKDVLDDLRAEVVPTVRRHHRLKSVDSEALGPAEEELAGDPYAREEIQERLAREAVMLPLEKAGFVRLEHVRPSGKKMRPREGKLVSIEKDRLVFRRSFTRGRYDGLDIPIRSGDYCLTELREGDWVVKHSYYTRQDRLIGEYYNINTPVELYPFGARYVDLEVDVIRRAGEQAVITDLGKFALLTRRGSIGRELEQKVLEISGELASSLNRG